MRYPQDHKDATRGAILDAAARMFRERGFGGSGVAKIMAETGLTHGGFYAHFPSKEALFAEALRRALESVDEVREPPLAGLEGRAWVEAYIELYLSAPHRDAPGIGCPLPPLAVDVARAGSAARRVFGDAVDVMGARIAGHLERAGLGEDLAAERALAILTLCVGALSVARGVEDDAGSRRILEAARRSAIALIDAGPDGAALSAEES